MQMQYDLEQLRRQNPHREISTLLAGKVLGTQTLAVTVPRCPQCKQFHDTEQMISMRVGLPSAILFAVLSVWIFDEWAAVIIGVIGLGVGALLGWIIGDIYRSSKKIESTTSATRHKF